MPKVISCVQIAGRTASHARNNKHSYTCRYRIVCDGPMWQPTVIIGAQLLPSNPLPKEFDYFSHGGSIDGSSFVDDISISEVGEKVDEWVWIAKVTYSPLAPNQTPADRQISPLLRPVKYWLEERQEYHPVEIDIDNKPIANAAGVPFTDPIMQEKSFPVLVAQKNIANLQTVIDHNLDYSLRGGAVNSKVYRGGAKRTVKYIPAQSGQIQYEQGVAFYPATYRFCYNPDTWDRKIVNRGFHYLDDNEKLTRAQDENGNDMVEPVLLTADGKRLPKGEIGNTITVQTRMEKDFTDLGV